MNVIYKDLDAFEFRIKEKELLSNQMFLHYKGINEKLKLNESSILNLKKQLADILQQKNEIAKKIKERVDIIGVEKIVFDEQLQLAGTIDFLGRSKKDGSYIIIDHKSNKEIELENKWNKFALDPISCIPDTNFGHYTC